MTKISVQIESMTQKTSKQIIFKVLAATLGIAIFFVGLEVAMRLTGWAIVEKQSFDNKAPDFSDPKEIRIVTLGESTTAQIYSEGFLDSWPRQLQNELNKKFPEAHFKIFNLAIPSVNTSQILRSFVEKYNDIRPHLVISMMGINDTSYVDIAEPSALHGLRVIKLASHIQDALKNKSNLQCGRFENQAEISRVVSQYIEKRSASFDEIHTQYLEKFKDNETYLDMFIGLELYSQYGKIMLQCQGECLQYREKIIAESFKYLQKTLKKCPADPMALKIFLFVCNRIIEMRSTGAKAIAGALKAGYVPDEETLGHIMTFVDVSNPDDVIYQYSQKRSYLVKSGRPYEITKKNYQRLVDFINLKNLRLVMMSYPTTRVESVMNVLNSKLKESYFTFQESMYDDRLNKDVIANQHQNIYFVSNENFTDFVKQTSFKNYFIDNFCSPAKCKFGHTTTRGHSLIAKNVMEQLDSLFRELMRPKKD